jgi:hypothetical protein
MPTVVRPRTQVFYAQEWKAVSRFISDVAWMLVFILAMIIAQFPTQKRGILWFAFLIPVSVVVLGIFLL